METCETDVSVSAQSREAPGKGLSHGNAVPDRCQFLSSNGRQCRLSRSPHHLSLCADHARKQEDNRADSQSGTSFNHHIARELAPLSGTFRTASDVNRVLGRLLTLVLEGRIARRDAVAAGYIAQLLLQTLPAQRSEIREVLGYPVWAQYVHAALESDAEEEEEEEEEKDDEADEANEPKPIEVEVRTCSSGLPGVSQPGDLRPVPHATTIDHHSTNEPPEAAHSGANSTDDDARAESFMKFILAAATGKAPSSTGTLACAPNDVSRRINREAAPIAPTNPPAPPPTQYPPEQKPEPKPDPKPERFYTFCMPGPNGTMQELRVTAESAEAAFALPPPKSRFGTMS